MDIIMATSRGRELEPYFERIPNTIMRVMPGSSIERLTHTATTIINQHPPSPSKPHFVYFIAGLPDVTTRTTNYARKDPRRYDEVTFPEEPSVAHDRLKILYEHTSSAIKDLHCIPIFATIAPCSLITWNSQRLTNHCKSHLRHKHQYKEMQDKLNINTLKMNETIIELNNRNDVFTPKLGRVIIFKQNAKRMTPRVRYWKLTDGTHPNQQTVDEWRSILLDAIIDNRRTLLSNKIPM